MDPELLLGAIQTIFAILAVMIAAVQLLQQWPRHEVSVLSIRTRSEPWAKKLLARRSRPGGGSGPQMELDTVETKVWG